MGFVHRFFPSPPVCPSHCVEHSIFPVIFSSLGVLCLWCFFLYDRGGLVSPK